MSDYLDEEGYPTKEALDRIRNWPLVKDYAEFNELMDFVYSIWWAPDWGWKKEDNVIYYNTVNTVYNISTGGWSGNESIINALQENWMFWATCWEQSRKGGHYIFKVRTSGDNL